MIVRVDSSVTPGSHGLRFVASTARLPAKRITVPISVAVPRPLPQSFSVTASTRDLTLVRGDSADVVRSHPFFIEARLPGRPTYTITLTLQVVTEPV